MTYPFQKPVQHASDGRTSLAFRLTGAILAGAVVLMFFMVGTGAGAWIAAVSAAGAAFVLAPVLIVIIMVVVPPVLIVVVIVRLAASAV
jgi:hypothetical protein